MNAEFDASANIGALYEPGKGSPHFRYNPLTVTRRSSQVCRVWRYLLLNSPSIWGRVFHLDLLDQRTADWRLEILRRTGQSPLCISGEVMSITMEDFFFALLDQEWTRIRRINVRLHNEWEFEDDAWEPLTRPTSLLESFNLALSGDTSFPSKFRTKLALFGNKAPSLLEFHPNNIKFSLQASWVSQLRCLEVSHPFTILEVIETIARMTFLDTVILGRGVRPLQPLTDYLPQVYLPSLRNIILTCLFETAVQFLEHVTPGNGCGLTVTPADSMLLPTDQEVEAACRTLAQCAQNYFSIYPPKRLLLNMTERFFYLQDLLDPVRSPSSPTLKMTFDKGSAQSLSKPILFKMLSFLAPTIMSDVETLDLLLDTSSVNTADPDFIQVLYSYTSLKVLQLSSLDTLPQLQHLPPFKSVVFPMNFNVLFPELQTLKITQSSEFNTNILQQFLVWRNRIGVPIRSLDLTFSSPKVFGDLRFLNEFDVKVKWIEGNDTVKEYSCCGTDQSSLDFRVR